MIALNLCCGTWQVPIVFADAFLRKQDLSYIANIDSSSQYAGIQWDLGNRAVGMPSQTCTWLSCFHAAGTLSCC